MKNARPTLRTDETNSIHGNWKVLEYAGSKRGKSLWKVQCINCQYQTVSLGRALRNEIYPRHKCGNPICRKCLKSSPEVEFREKGRFGNICISCRKQYEIQWRNNNSEYVSAYLSEWNTTNKETTNQYRENERQKAQSNPYLFLSYIFGVKLRNHRRQMTMTKPDERASRTQRRPELHHLTITPEFLHRLWDQQQGRCAITNMKMLHQFNNLSTVSIDRIDSEKGYTENNVQLVCRWVNLAKSTFTNEQITIVLDQFVSSRCFPFLPAPVEMMALAAPVIEWLKPQYPDLVLLMNDKTIYMTIKHDFNPTLKHQDLKISLHFSSDLIIISTTAHYSQPFAEINEFANPNLFELIKSKIDELRAFGSLEAVYAHRDAQQRKLNQTN